MEMSHTPLDDTVTLKAAVQRLRWLLTSTRGSGIQDFHRQRTPPPPTWVPPSREEDRGGGRDQEKILTDIREDLGDCRRCRLHSGRTNLVFGEGAPHAELVFVGEGPGFDEDRMGRPFVGRAGKLLDKMIQAIRLKREEVYICNAVKCRPPDNRTPNADEIEVCSPFLFRQLEAIRPRVICALGLCAAQTLLGRVSAMGKVRGKVFKWHGISVICTYHPAYLLRSPAQKGTAWQDLIEVRHILNAQKP
jgi:uracil-DNA glycosylase family 4